MVRRKIPRRRIILAVLVVGLTILILAFYLQHLTETARLGLVLRDLEARLTRLRDEVKTLEARKAALLSLAQVEKVARDDLKLVEPQPGQVIYEPSAEPHK